MKTNLHNAVTRRQPTFGKIRHVHMVGIGGIGMSSIAEVLLMRGYKVTGSDLSSSEVTKHLEDQGAEIFVGHDGPNAAGSCVVVHSSAVDSESNPETQFAFRHHIPVIRRSEMLGELMRMKFGIGIAGTHGKTTTTTMTGHVISAGEFDPTIIVGGKVSAFGSNAVSGDGDIILIEADEYDRTFLRLTPSIAVITNIDADHLDCYTDLEDIKDAFVQYASSVPFFGATIVCLDDENVRSILGRIDRRIVTYGTLRQSQIRAENIVQEGRKMHFDVHNGDLRLGRATLSAPGHHNVLNALAAIAVGLELDMTFDSIAVGIASYSGVQRRMEEIGEAGGILVVDDYAHHPTEVKATLDGAAGCWPDRRIIAVFQPHLYSRTQDLCDDFASSFFDADVVVIMDVYGAREAPVEGVSGELISKRAHLAGHPHVEYVPNKEELVEFVVRLSRPGDVVITLGAGDIWRLNRQILSRLQEAN
ncbi:UDP-N-acetylmuramate--L-alanine ligase [uncultured Gimesia sp.]|jgi:UDP-N-acetylmuramate--alanine ligase|uniref:UDP-N-acetylmuramate--L-alanine ligase n=1 Tax=uncultured Gimesia sp. TaxID=1678688 RepID=UPI00261C814A|nr:UDP-N-acetylmuramate--L-alanine ligase [uncultured Gimesia sp.]